MHAHFFLLFFCRRQFLRPTQQYNNQCSAVQQKPREASKVNAIRRLLHASRLRIVSLSLKCCHRSAIAPLRLGASIAETTMAQRMHGSRCLIVECGLRVCLWKYDYTLEVYGVTVVACKTAVLIISQEKLVSSSSRPRTLLCCCCRQHSTWQGPSGDEEHGSALSIQRSGDNNCILLPVSCNTDYYSVLVENQLRAAENISLHLFVFLFQRYTHVVII